MRGRSEAVPGRRPRPARARCGGGPREAAAATASCLPPAGSPPRGFPCGHKNGRGDPGGGAQCRGQQRRRGGGAPGLGSAAALPGPAHAPAAPRAPPHAAPHAAQGDCPAPLPPPSGCCPGCAPCFAPPAPRPLPPSAARRASKWLAVPLSNASPADKHRPAAPGREGRHAAGAEAGGGPEAATGAEAAVGAGAGGDGQGAHPSAAAADPGGEGAAPSLPATAAIGGMCCPSGWSEEEPTTPLLSPPQGGRVGARGSMRRSLLHPLEGVLVVLSPQVAECACNSGTSG